MPTADKDRIIILWKPEVGNRKPEMAIQVAVTGGNLKDRKRKDLCKTLLQTQRHLVFMQDLVIIFGCRNLTIMLMKKVQNLCY